MNISKETWKEIWAQFDKSWTRSQPDWEGPNGQQAMLRQSCHANGVSFSAAAWRKVLKNFDTWFDENFGPSWKEQQKWLEENLDAIAKISPERKQIDERNRHCATLREAARYGTVNLKALKEALDWAVERLEKMSEH